MKYQMWGRVLSVGRYLDASDLPFLGGWGGAEAVGLGAALTSHRLNPKIKNTPP